MEAFPYTKVLFVVDADSQGNDAKYGGYDNSLKALEAVAKDFGIEEVSSIYICCDPETQKGNIESLLLSALDEDKKVCIDNFIECSDFAGKENPKSILGGICRIVYPEAPI